jgi:hypothetical protein
MYIPPSGRAFRHLPLPLRGKQGNDPTLRDALPLELSMLTFIRRSIASANTSHPRSVLAGPGRPPRLRWRNFNICPHCRANGRRDVLERLNERGPMISRSDGMLFHIVLGDRPIEYPQEKSTGHSDMKSVGFWYLHEENAGLAETVVVILRKPPRGGASLVRHLELVADKLFEKLRESSHLPTLYEFDGQHLREVAH